MEIIERKYQTKGERERERERDFNRSLEIQSEELMGELTSIN